jgi:hypothetical protein
MYNREVDTARWQAEIVDWLPRILGALAILLIAYLLARAAKWAISKLVDRTPALKKHYEAEPGKTIGSLLGDIAFWLILLIGIMSALQSLQLTEVLQPVRQLTTNMFAFIPNLIAAALIFFIGLVIAKIVRRLIEGALLAANAMAGCAGPVSAAARRPAWPRPPVPYRCSSGRGATRPASTRHRHRRRPRSAARSV